MNSKSIQGYTLIEALIYLGIFAVISGSMVGILAIVTQIGSRESASAEVTSQLNFVMQRAEQLIRSSSNIEIDPGVSTSTLKLRTKDETKDPTLVYLDNGVIYLKEGSGSAGALTNTRVIVNDLSFKKFIQYPGHDTVSIDLTLTYNTGDPKSQVQRTLSSAIGRVSAATFDSDVLPGGSYNFSLGQSGSPWQNVIVAPGSASLPSYTFGSNTGVGLFAPTTDILGFSTQGIERFRIDASGNLGIGTTTPAYTLDVLGSLRISSSSFFGNDITLAGASPTYTINNVATPIATSSVATKGYVDAAGGGGGGGFAGIGYPGAGFGDGSDGTRTVSANTNDSVFLSQYTTLTVNSGVSLGISSSNRYRFILANNSITVDGTIQVNNNGAPGGSGGSAGGSGSPGYQGGDGGTASASAVDWEVSGSGGTGGTVGAGTGGTGGGAGGSGGGGSTDPLKLARAKMYLKDIERPALIAIPTFDALFRSYGAGGGGGGSNGAAASGGSGGSGGGFLLLAAPTITINAGGAVSADGQAGGNGFACSADWNRSAGGGGGGGGGIIILIYKTLVNNGGLGANGGVGGLGMSDNQFDCTTFTSGGAGANGFILKIPLQ